MHVSSFVQGGGHYEDENCLGWLCKGAPPYQQMCQSGLSPREPGEDPRLLQILSVFRHSVS